MKKAKREKRKLSRREKVSIGIGVVLASPIAAIALYLAGLIAWMSFGAAIFQHFAKPADILNDGGFPWLHFSWRDNMPEQDEWRRIVQDSGFTLGEPRLEQRNTGVWKAAFPDAKYPNIDGGTALLPMAVEFARQHLGMDAGQAGRFHDFSTTYNAYYRFCERTEHEYWFRDYFEGVDSAYWETGRPIDLLLGAPPGKEALELGEKTGVAFVHQPVCRDAFVFITGKDNPVDNLTLEQVRGVFSGEITNWREVGGAGEKIQAFQREAGSGSQQGMEELVMQGIPMADPITVKAVGGMGGLIDAVAEYRNSARSIGYSYRYYIDNQYSNENIKQLKIEGVAPTDENIISGAYPLGVEYAGVIRAGEEDGPGGLFLDWILSEEGQECVRQAGYITIDN